MKFLLIALTIAFAFAVSEDPNTFSNYRDV